MLKFITHVQARFVRLHNDKRGVTALEYGLIAAALVAAVGVGFTSLAGSMSTQFTNIGSSL